MKIWRIAVAALSLSLAAAAPAWAGAVHAQQGTTGSDWVTGAAAPDDTKSGTITALNGTVNMPLDGRSGASVILTGTWDATIIGEVSVDNGTTWVAANLYKFSDGTVNANTTANGSFAIVPTHGVSHIRVKASVFTSGTVTVKLRIAANNGLIRNVGGTGASADQVQGAAADGAAAVGNPVQVGGKDGAGNIQAVLTDTTGAVQADIESIAAGDNNIGNVDVLSISAGDNNIGNVDLVTGPTGATALQTQGTVADGGVAAQNPVQIGGKDGAGNIQAVLTDTMGAVQVDIESIAAGDNNIGNVDVLTIAAGDNNIGNVDVLSISAGDNNIGNVDVLTIAAGDNNVGNVDVVTGPTGATAFQTQGTVADGGIAAQNPVQIGGKDGAGNIQAVLTDTGGAVQVDVESGTITANAGTGTFTIGGAAADGIAVSGNPARIAGKDAGGLTQDVTVDADGDLQVDIKASLPAGTNAIGKLSANSGVDIGDVDILSIAAGDNNVGNVDIVTMPADATELPAAAALADAAGNPTTPTVGAAALLYNGATWDRMPGTTANGLDVDVTRLPALVAGTANIGDVDILTIAAGDNNIGNMDVASIAVGDNNIGNVDVLSISAGNNNIGDVDVATIAAGNNNIGDVDIATIAAGDNNVGNVDIVSLPALSTGPIASNPRTDVGTSVATQLIVGSTPCKKVTLVFDDGAATNGASGVMWVGGTSVAANNGIPLRAGQSLTLEVGNANTIWLFCTTATQKITWIAEN